jgi:hypothetical protein
VTSRDRLGVFSRRVAPLPGDVLVAVGTPTALERLEDVFKTDG